MSETETVYCSNCCQRIEKSKFFMHERMCSINVKKCPHCNKPFTVEDLEDHIEQEHSEVTCELCKRKLNKLDYEKHIKSCDYRMIPCKFCELEFLFKELEDHQITCGAITEQCPKCERFIQRKDLETHRQRGCRASAAKSQDKPIKLPTNNNIKNNNFINDINNIIDEDPTRVKNIKKQIEGNNNKIDIKIRKGDSNKPNIQFRPPSGAKVLRNNNNNNNKLNNINNPYNNNQNKNNPVKLKVVNDNNNKNKITTTNNKKNDIAPNSNNKRYDNNNNIGKKMSKPNFASNKSKASLNVQKGKDKKNEEEEFRKSREKFVFKPKIDTSAHMKKNATKINPSVNNVNKNNNLNNNVNNNLNNNKANIQDDFNEYDFGEVEDENALMQEMIARSLQEK